MSVSFIAWILVQTALSAGGDSEFPPELVNFEPYEHNPVFVPGAPGAWDEVMRERGWILKEDNVYHLWYTGYMAPESNPKKLGYATSKDGLTWTRYPGNPIHAEDWVEDITVVKVDGTYYMFAEGRDDEAHILTSTDRVHWKRQGKIDIRMVSGKPIAPGPFGTPAVIYENGTWYLFYERDDEAIWLATSKDAKVWTHVQDEPVIKRGPEPYDQTMIAVDQVLKYKDRYYAYYHATCPENGKDRWTMNVAVSTDLVHWKKYPNNPVLQPDHSSGFLVPDGNKFRMYCTHRMVQVFMPKTPAPGNDSSKK